METLALIPHPDLPSTAITGIAASIERHGDILSLSFAVAGHLDRVLWPMPVASARTDGLWMHTCFEAFVQPVRYKGYVELNLSPSGRWASYAFGGHRAGMRDACTAPERLDWAVPTLRAMIVLREIGGMDWRLGLSAVIEATDGSKSYWALAHAPGAPDFHNADCFTARLPAPQRP